MPKHLEPRSLARLVATDSVEQCRIDECALAESVAERVRFDGVRLIGGTLGARGSRLPVTSPAVMH